MRLAPAWMATTQLIAGVGGKHPAGHRHLQRG